MRAAALCNHISNCALKSCSLSGCHDSVGDVGVYHFNSLGNSVKKYASVDTFIRDYIERVGQRTQFAMLEPVAEYVNPLARYNF